MHFWGQITSKRQMSRGVQAGTIDALLIQLCRRNDLTLLTTDQDFHAATKHVEFRLWSAG